MAFLLGSKGIIKEESWSVLVEAANGQIAPVYQDFQKYLNQLKPPEMKCYEEKVLPMTKTLSLDRIFGQKRLFIRVDNDVFKDYRVLFGAKDYGNQLSVAWYLVYYPSLWRQILYLIPVVGVFVARAARLIDRNLFEEQELLDYVSTVHHAAIKTVENLMFKLGQDTSKIDRRSKGFLGVS